MQKSLNTRFTAPLRNRKNTSSIIVHRKSKPFDTRISTKRIRDTHIIEANNLLNVFRHTIVVQERRVLFYTKKGGVDMKTFTVLDWIAIALLIVGGLNWGLVGLFGFDLVAFIFGEMSLLSRIVYVVVGISAVYATTLCAKFGKS
jgi:uncharacterized membrane protein YuzA (DUF378 family)